MINQNLITKYLNIAADMPALLDNNFKLLSENNKIISDMSNDKNNFMKIFAQKQKKIYQNNLSDFNTLEKKYKINSNVFENSFDALNTLAVSAVMILSGSVLSLYEALNFKISLQNKYLKNAQVLFYSYETGGINAMELKNNLLILKDLSYSPNIIPPVVLVSGGLLFGFFYYLKLVR